MAAKAKNKSKSTSRDEATGDERGPVDTDDRRHCESDSRRVIEDAWRVEEDARHVVEEARRVSREGFWIGDLGRRCHEREYADAD